MAQAWRQHFYCWTKGYIIYRTVVFPCSHDNKTQNDTVENVLNSENGYQISFSVLKTFFSIDVVFIRFRGNTT